MPTTRRKYDPEFRKGAVQIVRETRKSIAEVARDLDIHPGALPSRTYFSETEEHP